MTIVVRIFSDSWGIPGRVLNRSTWLGMHNEKGTGCRQGGGGGSGRSSVFRGTRYVRFPTSRVGLSPVSLELINYILDAIIAEVFEVTFYGEYNGPSS